MRYLSCIIVVLFLLDNCAVALTYDNGQHNILDSFTGEEVRIFDSNEGSPTILELVPGGNVYWNVNVHGKSEFLLNGGTLQSDLVQYDNSIATLYDGVIQRGLTITNYSNLTILGGSITLDVNLDNSARVLMENGSLLNFNVRGNSHFQITGGSIRGAVSVINDGRFVIQGGSVADTLYAKDTSTAEVSGGWLDNGVNVRHDAEITVVGRDFNYPLGYVVDSSGTITGTLADGNPASIPFVREGNGSILLKDPNIVMAVIAPDGGERYLTDKPVDIEYMTEGDATIDTVDIEYSSDNGSSWITVATGISNTGIYEWTTPNIESENCIVRVSSSDNPTITDTSDGTFIIFQCSEVNPADVNNDCYVNFLDLAILAEEWPWCGDRYNPLCGVE